MNEFGSHITNKITTTVVKEKLIRTNCAAIQHYCSAVYWDCVWFFVVSVIAFFSLVMWTHIICYLKV